MRTVFCAELVEAIAGRSLASTMPKQIVQMLTFAFANRLLAAAEEPPTAQ
jgi:hypothetical protein